MKSIRSAFGGIQDSVKNLSLPSLPKLGREVAMPVYMIHNSKDANDYYFIFDFEEFVEKSREGIFVRPKLKVWAGRDDFDRTDFAHQFRLSFTTEFDAARAALANQGGDKGWFSWLAASTKDVAGTSLASFAANVVLLIALNTGGMVLRQILPNALLRSKSDETKLEDSIDATKAKVDVALESLELVLHQELYVHPYAGAAPAHLKDAEFDVWPLPSFVRDQLAG